MNKKIESEPFWKQKENIKVYISAILIVISWILGKQYGEEHIFPIIGYGAVHCNWWIYPIYERS